MMMMMELMMRFMICSFVWCSIALVLYSGRSSFFFLGMGIGMGMG